MSSISVHASGGWADRIPDGMRLEDVRTVGDAITQLQLPVHTGLIMLVNGRLAAWTTELQDGDTLQLGPALAGG